MKIKGHREEKIGFIERAGTSSFQQNSLQKIDQMQYAPGGNPHWFSAAGGVVAEALSELVKVTEVSGAQSIQGV